MYLRNRTRPALTFWNTLNILVAFSNIEQSLMLPRVPKKGKGIIKGLLKIEYVEVESELVRFILYS